MNLTKLQSLKSLNNISKLNSLQQNNVLINKRYLDKLELVLYSTNLCLFSTRILRKDIKVKNRSEVLNIVNDEVRKLYNLLSKKDFLLYSNYTKRDIREFSKKIGLKQSYLK